MEAGSEFATQGSLQLDALIPAIVRRRLAAHPRLVLQPSAESFRAALLLTDLSGFSTLAESFCLRGPRGAEDLRNVLNYFCGHLVDLVESHGGELFRFAGDAALALWPVAEGDGFSAVLSAAQCASAAQRLFDPKREPDGAHLRLRLGLGFGEVWSANVGGVAGRWEILVAGDPLRQAAGAIETAGPGEIAVSPQAWSRIEPHARGTRPWPANIRLEAVTAPVVAGPATAIRLAAEAEGLIRAYVPRSVQARFDARQSDWLAEFRRVTALFIRLDEIDDAAPDALDRLQRATVTVQTAVYRYGGSINQLVVDDKGTVVVCGWGLAHHAHDDDQVRAVRTALEVRDGLQQAGLAGSFGLATGDVFTGLLGNSSRCAYAMIGDAVNVAARLMQAAEGDIFCDLASLDGAKARVAFEKLSVVRVRGRERPVEVFRPIQVAATGRTEIVGRVRERRHLHERLDTLVRGRQGGIVILEGDAGIGKSRLVTDLIERAVVKGVRTIVTAGDAIERAAPYHVWRPLFDSLCGLDGPTGRGGAERRVTDLLESEPRLLSFAPLLNPVLRLNFPETEESRRVPPRGRATLMRELLINLLRQTTGGTVTLLVLEDAHWLDSASWALVEDIERELHHVLLLVATRPLSGVDEPSELPRLAARQGALRLHLEGLAPDEANALACQRLGARVLSEPVALLIRDKAEGHPFFIEELAYALREGGLVDVEQGACRLTAASTAIESLRLPSTVQVVISSRIDQLAVSQQLVLKVASIFGRTFDLVALQATYPMEVDPRDLAAHVEALIDRNLVQLSSSDPVPTYAFKHAITQEVAYSLLPYALRRQLHAAAAAWYERRHSGHLSPYYPLLAHHWSGAEVAEKALFYLDKAGEQALKRHANAEALRFYRTAVEIDETFAPTVQPDEPIRVGPRRVVSARDVRRIRWERCLGDASTNLCSWNEGRTHFKNVLRLIGRPFPSSDRGFAIGLATEMLVQCMRRLGALRFSPMSGPSGDLLYEAARSYERIGSISYQHGRLRAAAYALVAALNLGERLAPSSELAMAYADVSNVLGLVPLRAVARVYQRMAADTAARLSDPVIAARVRGRAALYRLGLGDWSACQDLESAMALFDQIGDSYLWEENAAVRVRAAHLTGDFELAAQLGAEVRRRAAGSGSIGHEIWGLGGEVWANLYLGRHQAALEMAKTGLRLLSTAPSVDQLATLDFLGATALGHLERGELDQAHQTAEQVLEHLTKTRRPDYFAILGMSAAAETCLTVWEAGPASHRGSEAAEEAQRLSRLMERYAGISPPARARSLLWRGCIEWLRGRPERAAASWRGSLDASERFALPYEAARTHYEIGRRLRLTDPERRVHLTRATQGFSRLKADSDLKRTAAALQIG
jgi:class 3 adenylate cyclase